MENSKQNIAHSISGETLDNLIQIISNSFDNKTLYNLQQYPSNALYCNICEILFKLPEIICKYTDNEKGWQLQSSKFHKNVEIQTTMARIFIRTLITCCLLNVKFGERYDNLESLGTRVSFDGESIREVCYKLSRRLPDYGNSYQVYVTMREFVRDLLRLTEVLNVDVYNFIKNIANEK